MTSHDDITARPGNLEGAAALEIRRLSPAIGIEVCGVDLSQPLVDSVIRRIRSAWEENCVVVFRGQRLSLTRQIRFASCFGTLDKTELGPPAVLEVTNVRDSNGRSGILPEGPIDFHSDQSYLDRPSIATLLYAVDVPAQGGKTLFANGFRAYESLPDAMKRHLSTRSALHVYDYDTHPQRRPDEPSPNVKRAVHPIFRSHGPTGRLALYVSRLMTWSILDMEPAESRQTLDFLFRHQERPELIYEHDWRAGDVVLWDNRSCIHARTDFDPGERRRLRRVTVLDDRP
jgi:alpha-ketoglutarate-dependent taurine dioxygenase